MIKIELNDIKYSVIPNISVIETCLHLGFYVPRFCYHETLSVAGNCRMCVVEIANAPKPVASCALPILNGMKIYTNSPLVKKARENVAEALLINHPLDCPICDRAGECDLQDQVKVYGNERARFFFNKRVVEDKQCNSLIKTIMTRCIHCTRCVRFNSEISGNEFFGTLNRGSHTEIGGYGLYHYDSEISANVIDLCPVGALTSQQYAFKARPWKLIITESIDITDGLCSSVYVSVKESDIFKISPKKNRELNGDIISDKARFSFDSNKNNRLDKFIGLKNIVHNFENFNLKDNKISFLFDNFLNLDSFFYLKQLQNTKSNLKLLNERKYKLNFYINWLNNQVSIINKSSITNCFILSSNIRLENSIINTKLRIKQQKNNMSVFGFSCFFNETFPVEFLSFNLDQLCNILESKNAQITPLFIQDTSPLFIFGENMLKRGLNSSYLFYLIKQIIQNTILIKISSINAEMVHFFNFSKINSKNLDQTQYFFLLNLDECFFTHKILKRNNIKKYWINTHVNSLKTKETALIPLTTEYEQESIYCNLEERIQKTSQIFSPLNQEVLNLLDIFDTHCHLMFIHLHGYKNYIKHIKYMLVNSYIYRFLNKNKTYNFLLLKKFIAPLKTNISKYPLKTEIEDFFLSNKFLKQSKVMQICSQKKRKDSHNFYTNLKI